MTKLRCLIRENAKDLDGIRDLTATREARFAKNCARDAGFFACLSGIREIVTTQIQVLEAKANQSASFEKEKNEIRDSDEESAGCGLLVKKERECGIRTPSPPSSRPCYILGMQFPTNRCREMSMLTGCPY